MVGKIHKRVKDLIKDKVPLALWKRYDDFLNYMCALLILCKLIDITSKTLLDLDFLNRQRDQVEHCLNCVCTFLVTTDHQEFILDHF